LTIGSLPQAREYLIQMRLYRPNYAIWAKS
jgi:hypothetical protein